MPDVSVTALGISWINLYQSLPSFANTYNLKGHGTFLSESLIESGFCYPFDGTVQAGTISSAC
jgi:hypothetical protein